MEEEEGAGKGAEDEEEDDEGSVALAPEAGAVAPAGDGHATRQACCIIAGLVYVSE